MLPTYGQKIPTRICETAGLQLGIAVGLFMAISRDEAFAAPAWRDASNSSVTTTQFVFAGFAKATVAQNIDSQSLELSLTEALNYPASVAITRPSECSIGSKNINNKFVYLLLNGSVYKSNTTVQILNRNFQNWKLRFSSEGNYGNLKGAVACAVAGRLRYSY